MAPGRVANEDRGISHGREVRGSCFLGGFAVPPPVEWRDGEREPAPARVAGRERRDAGSAGGEDLDVREAVGQEGVEGRGEARIVDAPGLPMMRILNAMLGV